MGGGWSVTLDREEELGMEKHCIGIDRIER